MFQDNAWNRTLSEMAVFDDVFVDQNVHSGLAVGAEHRQNLHELILGAQGVALNKRLHSLVERIEVHNSELRAKGNAIPEALRGAMSLDEFCGLPERDNLDDAIQAAERELAAALEQDTVKHASAFESISLPQFDLDNIQRTLERSLSDLDTAAAERVQAHFVQVGPDSEVWISQGMEHLTSLEDNAEQPSDICPFCAQRLEASPVIAHYRAYFSEEYEALKRSIAETAATVSRSYSGDVLAGFERSVRVAAEGTQFWSRFCDVPDLRLDTAAIVLELREAGEALEAVLRAKEAAPLERMALAEDVRAAVAAYDQRRAEIDDVNRSLVRANVAIDIVKRQAAVADASALRSDLSRLKAVRARHSKEVAPLCEEYLSEKAAKAATERERSEARAALDQYRTAAFPQYQGAINLYLERFNAGFRLESVTAVNTRGGPSCTYSVIVNAVPVAVSGGDGAAGEPSFRTVLSTGDRNTLALAFFFASLDRDPQLARKVVVIDDPVSSLDEHRSLTTVQEVRRLSERAAQVIVLSHSKPFLGRIWEGADRTLRAALTVVRDGDGSTLEQWDVDQDSISEQDRRHSLLRAFLAGDGVDSRQVARAIRPLLEAFIRVAYPEHFPPGSVLGRFHGVCVQRLDSTEEILDRRDTQELRDLMEYSNRFHHDTNPAWETEAINEGELRGFVGRAVKFARR